MRVVDLYALAATAAARQSAQEASSGTGGSLVGGVSWRQISFTAIAHNSDWLSAGCGLSRHGVDHSVCLSVDIGVGSDGISGGRGAHDLLIQWHGVHDIVLWKHVVAVGWRVGSGWCGG